MKLLIIQILLQLRRYNELEWYSFFVSFQVFRRYLTFCGIGIQNAQLFEVSILEYKKNQVHKTYKLYILLQRNQKKYITCQTIRFKIFLYVLAFAFLSSELISRANEFRTSCKYNHNRSQGIAQMWKMYSISFRAQNVRSGKQKIYNVTSKKINLIRATITFILNALISLHPCLVMMSFYLVMLVGFWLVVCIHKWWSCR